MYLRGVNINDVFLVLVLTGLRYINYHPVPTRDGSCQAETDVALQLATSEVKLLGLFFVVVSAFIGGLWVAKRFKTAEVRVLVVG
jgi:hypothetical protein